MKLHYCRLHWLLSMETAELGAGFVIKSAADYAEVSCFLMAERADRIGRGMPRIMTVDDSEVVRAIITESLRERGYQVVEAQDGEEALELTQVRDVDLIILDVMMPRMDGPTMLAELRARDNKTPVLLLTSKTETAVITDCVKKGLTDYLLKPVNLDQLCERVSGIIGLARTPGTESNWGNILLVDDSENVAFKFRELLPEPIELEASLDAREALLACSNNVFRVIVVDMELPGEDSVELVEKMRLSEPGAQYFAMYTRKQKEPELAAWEAGFDGYLVKPFSDDRVRSFLALVGFYDYELADVLICIENLLQAKGWQGFHASIAQYYSKLGELVGIALDSLAANCFESVTLDFTYLPPSDFLPLLVGTTLDCCADLGLKVRMVGGNLVEDAVTASGRIAEVSFFESLNDAMDARRAIEG